MGFLVRLEGVACRFCSKLGSILCFLLNIIKQYVYVQQLEENGEGDSKNQRPCPFFVRFLQLLESL